jgi:hypothetical protein
MVLIFVQGVGAASFYLVFKNEIKDTADNPTRRDAPKKGANKINRRLADFL